MDDLVKSLKAINGVTYLLGQITQQATLSIVSSVAGIFHAAIFGSPSSPTLTIYDNASGASGTILGLIEPGTRGSYIVDVAAAKGISVYVQPGNTPNAFISYR